MDKTTLAYQIFLRSIRKRCQNTNLDCGFCLCAGGYYQKWLKIDTSLYNILKVLSPTLFEKISLIQLLDKSNNNPMLIEDSIQLNLFDNFLGH